MKSHKVIIVLSLMVIFMFSSTGFAGEYGWMRDLNLKAEADPAGFVSKLEERYKVGRDKIKKVLNGVDKPADAYMLFELGEMSDRPIDDVVEKHKAKKGKGWGALAKSLGIKPGSADFHALKQEQSLYDERMNGRGMADTERQGKGKGKGKGKNKGKGKGKGKAKGKGGK